MNFPLFAVTDKSMRSNYRHNSEVGLVILMLTVHLH